MSSCENLSPDGRFNALFVGASGTGKTPAACSFQTPNEKTFVWDWDFDGRIRGLLGCPWVDRSRISYDYFPPMKSGVQTFSSINDKCEMLQNNILQNKNLYETIVLDSLTGMCNCLICDAIPLAHTGGAAGKSKGRKLGAINMPGMEEYGYEANGTDQIISFLRSIPIKNFIATAHIVDKYGKIDPDDPYSATEVIGTTICLRPKISAKIGIYFDNIFIFSKEWKANKAKYFVEFRGELARTVYSGLPDRAEITNMNFYEYMQGQLKK